MAGENKTVKIYCPVCSEWQSAQKWEIKTSMQQFTYIKCCLCSSEWENANLINYRGRLVKDLDLRIE